MKEIKQSLYEGMYILSARLSDDARKKAIDKLHEGINGQGGKILKMHEWGRRRLAYEINGHREGYYYIMYFNAPNASMSDLWREYALNEDLVRFITLRANEVVEKIEFKSLVEQ